MLQVKLLVAHDSFVDLEDEINAELEALEDNLKEIRFGTDMMKSLFDTTIIYWALIIYKKEE